MTSHNQALFDRAQRHIPGGVNSPVRAFGSVGGTPRFFVRGSGAYVWDADGKRYIDYVGSWGPLILGHAHPDVINAVKRAADNGLSFGAPTEQEIDLADLLCEMLPSVEKVRNDAVLYAHANRVLHLETNPGNARALVQAHGEGSTARDVWINPPPVPLTVVVPFIECVITGGVALSAVIVAGMRCAVFKTPLRLEVP